ncbi:unnamed protein product, partial [Sphacelaria rigidula]
LVAALTLGSPKPQLKGGATCDTRTSWRKGWHYILLLLLLLQATTARHSLTVSFQQTVFEYCSQNSNPLQIEYPPRARVEVFPKAGTKEGIWTLGQYNNNIGQK